MRKLLIVMAFVLMRGSLYAQNAKLFLNKREIALPSVHFLEAATIDSINFYTGDQANEQFFLPTKGIDSVYVIFKHDMTDVVTYHQLLNLSHLDERARALPLDLGSVRYRYVDNAQTMVFNLEHVPSVSVQTTYTHIDYVSLFRAYRRPYDSDAGKMLIWLQGYCEGYGDNVYYNRYKRK
ncbi:hypothetical protein [Mucilaginibacter antarcticus]|uniref:Uncharacterized protein n=1 Tax=Mucilaginibacter antarcticus TaxID=1855725 RepID=A0ABW5XL99_9SPHI